MRRPILLYLVMLIAYLAIDSIWLTLTTNSIYRATLGDILVPGFRLIPAIAVYFLQVFGLMVFVIPRAIATGRGVTALFYGAAFGLFTYGLYDLTNDATLRHWTLRLTLTDMAWGAIISGLVSLIGWSVSRRFGRQRIFS